MDDLRDAIKALDEENLSLLQRGGNGWSGSIGGWVPVQAEGIIDGHPWYFRARGDSWSLSIAENPKDTAIDVRWNKVPGWYFEEGWGMWPEAGWMPYAEAWKFIEASFEKYRAGQGYSAVCDDCGLIGEHDYNIEH